LRKAIVDHLRSLSSEANAELQERQGRRDRTQERLAHLVDFIAQGNASPTVAGTIDDLEAQLRQEEEAIAALRARAKQPTVLPSPDAVLKQALRMREILDGDPLRAREYLQHLFRGEGITMTPQPDGSYTGEGVYFPLMAFCEPHGGDALTTKRQRPGRPGRSRAGSCAGAISPMYTAIGVRAEVRIAA
jgi:hypothetical protein